MKIDILTLFPEHVNAMLHESILGRACKKGILDINCVQIRDYTENRQNQVDDYPYGGGFGCVMMAQPLKACLDATVQTAGERRRRVIYLSPQGEPFNQETARRLQRDYDYLILVCGHYEGVDERFLEACVDEEISLGDFVLTGGELAAMAVTDAVCRLVPGVLSDPQCYIGESHWDGLLEYPQYTRPENWEGRAVPEVLLNGDHQKVERWRRMQQLERTRERRPDLYRAFRPRTKEDAAMIRELEHRSGRVRLTEPLSCRPATEADLPRILEIREAARESLARSGVDQWQGPYPAEEDFKRDLDCGESFVVMHGSETAAFFTLSTRREPEYDAIRDGKWSENQEACILRRAAVAREYRGSGVSGAMMRFVGQQTLSWERRCIRAAVHRKNKPAQNMLRENGFRYRGNITVSSEPGHDPERLCFEKILKKPGKKTDGSPEA